MQQITENVFLIGILPNYGINAYLIGDVLVDAGIRPLGRVLFHQLRGRRLAAHILTHAHPDHQGASHAICSAFNIPLWCGEADASAQQSGDIAALLPRRPFNAFLVRCFAGPAHPVTRRLHEGDRIGEFTIVATPGHTPGHISLWRESDRTLILGDVLANVHPVTQQVGLIEPLVRFTLDPAQNRASIRKIAALEPRLICFGHGPPLREPDKLRAFVETLPDDHL